MVQHYGMDFSILEEHYVYILECYDGKFYTGYTSNLEQRIQQHKNGLSTYTKSRLPIKLVHFERFKDKKVALKREKTIKKMSRYEKTLLIP